jgi:hypothetical protein
MSSKQSAMTAKNGFASWQAWVLRSRVQAGAIGGLVYAALHPHSTQKSGCDRIYTFKVKDFRAWPHPPWPAELLPLIPRVQQERPPIPRVPANVFRVQQAKLGRAQRVRGIIPGL